MRDLEAARQLRRALRVFGLSVLPLGLAWLIAAAIIGDVSALLVGLLSVVFGIFMLVEYRTSSRRSASSIATRAAVVTEVAIVLAATIETSLAIPMTMAALIPPVLAFAYTGHREVIRLMVVGGVVGTWSALAPHVLPWSSDLIAP